MIKLYDTDKSVDTFIEDIQKVFPDYKFGLQHIHNPPEKIKAKGLEFENECKILDICNPFIAKEILDADIAISSAIPCRISVYNKNGQTTVAFNSFVQMIDDLNPDLIEVAKEAEEKIIKMIEESI